MVMILTDTVATVTFWREGEDGAMRIGDTRVSLDSVYYKFMAGASAERIADSFPGLRVSQIHATIAYILDNREEVEEYLRKGEIVAERNRKLVEEKFGKRNAELKKVILARQSTRLKPDVETSS